MEGVSCNGCCWFFLQSLWEKPIWDAMDTVCLRTASMEWNVLDKYGPHGELLFFLIQKKKPAIEPNSEALNSFIGDGFQVPELKGESESSGGIQAGNVNNEALQVIGLHGSGDKISLFLQDRELAKVALSCHMALDMLCQEMYEVHGARGGRAGDRVGVGVGAGGRRRDSLRSWVSAFAGLHAQRLSHTTTTTAAAANAAVHVVKLDSIVSSTGYFNIFIFINWMVGTRSDS